ncbi:gamma-glutamyl-gamma-aminobutyrate hydrolase family protein, partial [Streptomyces sp. NPDC059096]|uniref:glutamine amidotransferase-related protein n=1 Tax=Streptomyces sp. NPDC059096 TaxID=3346727 RepID=UPI003686C582
MKTLLIDKDDSSTYNLSRLIAEVNGEEPVVLLDDAPTGPELDLRAFDNIVVSPGPGHPATARDVGIGTALLARSGIPVLGVFLGHQGIAVGELAQVVAAPRPRHGHLSMIRHDGRELFRGIPQNFTAVRYHSLAVREPLPSALEATAWAEDGVPMGLRHRTRPMWGVRFHPESILTGFGHRMLTNFAELTASWSRTGRARAGAGTKTTAKAAARAGASREPASAATGTGRYRLHSRAIDTPVDPEAAFTRMRADVPRAFWLDGARVEAGPSRFSFFGDGTGPLAEFVRYDVESGPTGIERAGRADRRVRGSVFDHLRRQLALRAVDAPGPPFDFTGGYVGYFGYERKAECGSPSRHRAETPDACRLFADRIVAVDHQEGATYALVLAENTPRAARE